MSKFLSGLGKYGKFWTALAGVALTFATQYYGDNTYVALAVAAAASIGVYAVPNTSPAPQTPEPMPVVHRRAKPEPVPPATIPGQP